MVPMDRENVDTDAIIPKQFLKSIKQDGFGGTCSTNGATWTTAGQPGWMTRRPNPDFVLNQPRYAGASILLARKIWLRVEPRTRPWALDQYGFRCVIAPSFADIFFNNCFRTASCPSCCRRTVAQLFDECWLPGYRLTIDLERQ